MKRHCPVLVDASCGWSRDEISAVCGDIDASHAVLANSCQGGKAQLLG